MRQLTFLEPGRVEWTEGREPILPGEDGALIRPVAVARCDLDLRMAVEGLFPGPYPVGHEAVCEVIQVGEHVRSHRAGDLVMVPFQVSCGTCPPCTRQNFAACHRYRAPAGSAFGFGTSGGDHGGAVADLLAVPHADHMLNPVPEGLPAEIACMLTDNAVDGFRTVAPHLNDRPGSDVLVVGGSCASVGLFAVATATALGASSVRYVDDDPERCEAAERLGAQVERRSGRWPRRFERAPITVANTDDPQGLIATVRSTDDYGTCTVTSIFFGSPPPLPLLDMYTKGITLHTSRADSRRYMPEVVKLVVAGAIEAAVIPYRLAAWEDAPTAWLTPTTKLVVIRDPIT